MCLYLFFRSEKDQALQEVRVRAALLPFFLTQSHEFLNHYFLNSTHNVPLCCAKANQLETNNILKKNSV